MKKIILSLALVAALFSGFYLISGYTVKKEGFAGTSLVNSQACTVSTVAQAVVGNQSSVTLLASNSRRAWAIIEQPINATNTVSVSFNAGAAATLTTGIDLQAASTTSAISDIRFGLATDFPYTGAVTGITNVGSTTVKVTQCVF